MKILNFESVLRCFLHAIFALAGAVLPSFTAAQVPPNDNCDVPSIIVLPGNGYGIGSVTSDTILITRATKQNGEYFFFNALKDKSVWYEFHLPSRRSVKVDLFHTGNPIVQSGTVGMSIFKTDTCLPNASTPIAMSHLNTFSFVGGGCLEPGTYRIQVTASAAAAGSIYLTLTIDFPNVLFDFTDCQSPFDQPTDALKFGALPPNSSSIRQDHVLCCQSIEGIHEYECIPVADPSKYLKSSWYTFTTDDFEDILSFQLYGPNSLPGQIGFRLLEGDVTTSLDPFALPVVDECILSKINSSSYRIVEEPCKLQPNTTYSFEWIFPESYTSGTGEITVYIFHRGTQITKAPQPIKSLVDATTNALGVLPQSASGVTTTLNDWFSCNARMSLNACSPANPVAGLVYNNKTFDLATYATFELISQANLHFDFQEYFGNFIPYVRLFKEDLTEDCSSLNDLLAEFNKDQFDLPCVPPGKYTLQILGHSDYPLPQTFTYYQTAFENGHLGKEFHLNIKVSTTQVSSLFALQGPTNINLINNGAALTPGVFYPSDLDAFGCEDSALPDGSTCSSRQKSIYRQLVIGETEGGLMQLTKLKTDDFWSNPPPDVHYRLQRGNIHRQAIEQNTFSPGDIITGTANYLGADFCIEDSPNFVGIDTFNCCVIADTFVLVSLGDGSQVNISDQPGFLFKKLNPTQHYSREMAQNLGDVANLSSLTSDRDWFSCQDNPATIGGLTPCSGATKMIYREFYLSAPKIVRFFRQSGSAGTLALFSGQASDPAAVLTPWNQLNSKGRTWVSCFTDQTTSDCNTLPPGWYTVVAYGIGPGFGKPALDAQGSRGDVGKYNQFTIETSEPIGDKYDRPWKAYQAGITDWYTAGATDPYATTAKTYTFDEDIFCNQDIPFAEHPLLPCQTEQVFSAYFVFEITQTSFVAIQNIPDGLWTTVFPFDARATPDLLATVPAVYPCVRTPFKQLCDLPPGKYSLVVMGKASDEGKVVQPKIYVEKTGKSRFDHARQAYEWGVVPNDNTWRNGRPGHVNPVFPMAAPSYDVFYCTTGAQLTDPDNGFNDWFCGYMHNPNVYNPVAPHVLYTDEVPTPYWTGRQGSAWRNLWQTFVLTGSGNATLRFDFPTAPAQLPFIGVYESNVDGRIPFSELIQNGGVDSTTADGLRLVGQNYSSCNSSRNSSLSFQKNGCLRDSVRYYILITMPTGLPKLPVELSIRYEAGPVYPVIYDHISEANVINAFRQTAPPYNIAPLTNGWYLGAPSRLQCATLDPGDPAVCSNNGRTVWYKLHIGSAGLLRLALEKDLAATTRNNLPYYGARLFREQIPGDAASLVQVNLSTFYASSSSTDTIYHNWSETCVKPGNYYLMFNDCYAELDPLAPYRPIAWIQDSFGDRCDNAVPLAIAGEGMFSASVQVDCHTRGEDFGEDGYSSTGCLGDLTGKKTSWVEISLTGDQKMDLLFSASASGISLANVRYRILYGSCAAMTPGPCNPNAGTVFQPNCLTAGDYYVQIITPDDAEGTVTLNISAQVSLDQTCRPTDPTAPQADFTYTGDCSKVVFENLSTAGANVVYLWQFPGRDTSTETNPTWYPNTPGPHVITLTVTNLALRSSSTMTQTIETENPLAGFDLPDMVLCNGETGTLDASLPDATYLWWDGSTSAIKSVDQSGRYWVTVTLDGCSVADTVEVQTISSEKNIQIELCPGESETIGSETYHTAGVFQQILTSEGSADCDSILHIEVIMHSADTIRIMETTCRSELAGIQFFSYQNQQGCDSTVTITTLFDNTLSISSIDTAFICNPAQVGAYTTTYISDQGCDSVVTITNLLLMPIVLSDTLYTCHPEEAGTETMVWSSYLGCDSLIYITETIYDPSTIDTIKMTVVTCDPNNGGLITYGRQAGEDGCEDILETVYTYSAPDTTYFFNPTCDSSLAGTVLEVYQNQAGCDSAFVFTVTEYQPADFSLSVDRSDYHGFGISCPGEEDGSIAIRSVSGGAAPYRFLWSNDSLNDNIGDLPAGSYSVAISDKNGCEQVFDFELNEPSKFEIAIEKEQPGCGSQDSGRLKVAVSGNTGPYLFWMDNGISNVSGEFTNLKAGSYQITVADVNGCEQEISTQLEMPLTTTISFPENELSLHLVDSTQLMPRVSVEPDSLSWTPTSGLSCTDCLNPYARPGRTTDYTLEIWAKGYCSTAATVRLNVDSEVRIYVPNAFSPNSDGENDLLQVYAAPEVVNVRVFGIMDRWGNMIYKAFDFPPNSLTGWDGRFRGQLMQPAVFVWFVEAELANGERVSLDGEVHLVR